MKNSRKPLIIVSMALLLAVVLAMGGVTFAKYISTTGTHSNQANVAKWGFTMDVDATDLFNNAYKADTDNLSVVADDGKVIVSASEDVNVIAPGSKGSMTFSIGGTAEVLSRLEVKASSSSDIILKETGKEDYKPVKWTLVREYTDESGVAQTTTVLEDKNITDVVTYLEGMDQDIEANTRYALDGKYTLSWEWAFSVDADTDAKDTALGMVNAGTKYVLAEDGVNYDIEATGADAKYDGTTCNIQFQIEIIITQIQANTPVAP